VPLESAESGLGGSRPAAVALDCEMVDVLCDDGFPRGAAARVCVVDEAERVLLHSLIKPSRQVVDYKFEFTGEHTHLQHPQRVPQACLTTLPCSPHRAQAW